MPRFGGVSFRRPATWLVVGIAVIGIGAVLDLAAPVHGDLRVFDPDPVARLDGEMWRSYYDRKPLPMYLELADLLRRQFHFPYLRSYVAAFHASRAAFTFKHGHARTDYLLALPDLRDYFGAIRAISVTPFDVHEAAERELEWWIVHRERGITEPDSLARSLAAAASTLYQVPAESLMTYGRQRGAAMAIRDTCARNGGMRESDWVRVRLLLDQAWGSLWRTVRNNPPHAVAAITD